MEEKKFYLVQHDYTPNCWLLSDEEFIKAAEEEGSVFTEKEFVQAFNEDDVSSVTQILRII